MKAHRPQFTVDFAAALAQLGFPRMPAQVFSELLAMPEESLTARELADHLGVSPAAISGAVRYLIQLKLVRRSRPRGERADRYDVGDEVWAPVLEAEVAAYAPLIQMCVKAVESGDVQGRGQARVEETRRFMEFMKVELGASMSKWRAMQQG